MIFTLVHNLVIGGLVIAMLAAPVAGMHPPACGECTTLADTAVGSVKSNAACCASPAQSPPASSTGCSDHDYPSLPCQLCCVASPTSLPVAPATNVQQIDFGVKSFADVCVTVDADVASAFAVRTVSGPFWTLAADGPSRQAILCRFTT